VTSQADVRITNWLLLGANIAYFTPCFSVFRQFQLKLKPDKKSFQFLNIAVTTYRRFLVKFLLKFQLGEKKQQFLKNLRVKTALFVPQKGPLCDAHGGCDVATSKVYYTIYFDDARILYNVAWKFKEDYQYVVES